MGILDVVKQAIGIPAGESERQQREQEKLAKEIAEQKARDAQALKDKAALDRQQADQDRLRKPGPTERLINGRIVVPDPSQQQEQERKPVTPKTAEPMTLKPVGQQAAPSPGGGIFFPQPVRPTQSQPAPEPRKDSPSLDIPPTPSQKKVMERLRSQPEDLADQVARELKEKRQAAKDAYDRLSPEDRRAVDALNQLEKEKRAAQQTHDMGDRGRWNTR